MDRDLTYPDNELFKDKGVHWEVIEKHQDSANLNDIINCLLDIKEYLEANKDKDMYPPKGDTNIVIPELEKESKEEKAMVTASKMDFYDN